MGAGGEWDGDVWRGCGLIIINFVTKFTYLWFRIECVVMRFAVPNRTLRYMIMMEEIIVFQTADLKVEKKIENEMLKCADCKDE